MSGVVDYSSTEWKKLASKEITEQIKTFPIDLDDEITQSPSS